jgi:hypothetical protein
MAVSWAQFKGIRYLDIDYRACRTQQEMIALLEEATNAAAEVPGRLLALTHLEGCGIGPEFMGQAKERGKALRVREGSRHAILGITGLKNMLLKTLITVTGWKHTKPFDSETQALEWLIS